MAENLAHWLDGLGLGQYVQTFAENDIDFDVLARLSDDNLKELGLTLGHRVRLQAAIEAVTKSGEITEKDYAPASLQGPVSYTPKHLAERILKSRSALEGERKQITVLFADIKGSTALIDGLDPEQAIRRLEPALNAMLDAVHRYEGTVNKIQGDGIMALFGAPLAHEDHAVRACNAALAMREALGQNEDADLSIRIGLHSGEVVVRSIANDLSMNYDAVGPTVHVAGRMEQLAEPQSIRMTASTFRLVEGFIEARPLGPTAVKGVSEPIELFELIGSSPERTRWQVRVSTGLTQFVGRDEEMASLVRAQGLAGMGQGQLVTVVGDAGMGKSRLVHEFLYSKLHQDMTVLETSGVPQGSNATYLPVRKLLQAWSEVGESDGQAEIAQRLHAKIVAVNETLLPNLPALCALLDLPVEDADWQRLDPPLRRRRIIDAVRMLILQSSQLRPLVLVVEDLHWIDPETQAVLDSLIDGMASARLLVVVTYRPEYGHGWTEKTYCSSIDVDPLGAPDADQFLRSLLGDDRSLDRLIQLLNARAEGTPLFLEETVHMLAETGALDGDKGGYRLVKAVEEIEIPVTVQSMLAARIDRLPPEQKSLLQMASVIGKDVPLGLLESIADFPGLELRRELAGLRAHEFMYETRVLPEPEYTFKHALTRDVAYGSVLVERRQMLHGKLVDSIEARYRDRLDAHIELLAYHALYAERWEKAHSHNRRAAMKALSRSAYRTALVNFEQALVALDHISGEQTHVQDKMDVRLEMRSALFPLGRHEDWVARVREAETMAKEVGDKHRLAMVYNFLTVYYWQRSQHEDAIRHGEEGLKLTEGTGDFSVRVSTMFHLGLPYQARGDYRRQTDLHRSVAELLVGPSAHERHGMAGLPSVISRALLAWGLSEQGRFQEAESWATEAIEIAEPANNAYSTIWGYAGLGIMHLRQGNLDTAIELMEPSVKLCRDAEVRIVFSVSAGLLGYACALSQNIRRGLALLEEAARPDYYDVSIGAYANILIWLAEAYLLDGQTERARETAVGGLKMSRDHGEKGHQAWALRLMGDIEAKGGNIRFEEAIDFYRQASDLAGQLGMRPLTAHCRFGLGMLHHEIGGSEAAQADLSAAVELYRAMHMRSWMSKAKSALAIASAGDGT